MENVIRDLCEIEAEPDGLIFQPGSVHGERIKDEEEYEGVRLRLIALLGQARIPLQIDVGFGDRVVPGPEEIDFPTLLDFPAPHLKIHSQKSRRLCANFSSLFPQPWPRMKRLIRYGDPPALGHELQAGGYSWQRSPDASGIWTGSR